VACWGSGGEEEWRVETGEEISQRPVAARLSTTAGARCAVGSGGGRPGSLRGLWVL
jgi:hypothetical protein